MSNIILATLIIALHAIVLALLCRDGDGYECSIQNATNQTCDGDRGLSSGRTTKTSGSGTPSWRLTARTKQGNGLSNIEQHTTEESGPGDCSDGTASSGFEYVSYWRR